jgi:putative spermidine/putrescine transport system ATP-binding protein
VARLDVHDVRFTYPKAERPAVDVSLSVGDGELVSLLGPSGCGKTTALRILAGFLTPQFGIVAIDGADITAMQPQRRPTAMVFQQYALWPHMTVWHNVAFGLFQRHVPRPEVDRRVRTVLEMLGLGEYGARMPAQLSGGQQQRVALARALVVEPKILLLDEPLSNLDANMREHVRDELRQLQRRLGITTVFVTHDQSEALGLSDRVAVMADGRIAQLDRPAAIYATPGTIFVAGFIGTMNIEPGDVLGDGVRLGGTVIALERHVPVAHGVTLAIRPEDVLLGPGDGDGSPARVVDTSLRGADSEVRLEGGFGTLRAMVTTESAPRVGTTVAVRLRRILAYEREGGRLLPMEPSLEVAR